MGTMKFLLCVVAAATASVALFGQGKITREGRNWVEEINGKIPAAARIRVVSPEGGIEVRGAAQSEISYRVRKRTAISGKERARQALAACGVNVRRIGDLVELIVESPKYRGVGADFYLTVPHSLAKAILETRGGGVLAEDLEGDLNANTAGGRIRADRIGRTVAVETAGGDIKLGQIGGSVRAQTAGGGIELQSCGGEAVLITSGGHVLVGTCQRGVRAETAGGEIRIARAGGDVKAETAGGDVRVGEAAGMVFAKTSGGSIHVDAASGLVKVGTAGGKIQLMKILGPVRAENASGSILARVFANRQSWGDSSLETAVGDVTVYLPANLAVTIRATIEAAGARHRIVSDFPLNIRAGGVPGPREVYGEGQINGGGAPLRIRTISGNIEIRKNP